MGGLQERHDVLVGPRCTWVHGTRVDGERDNRSHDVLPRWDQTGGGDRRRMTAHAWTLRSHALRYSLASSFTSSAPERESRNPRAVLRPCTKFSYVPSIGHKGEITVFPSNRTNAQWVTIRCIPRATNPCILAGANPVHPLDSYRMHPVFFGLKHLTENLGHSDETGGSAHSHC